MSDPATTLSPPVHREPPFSRHRDVALVAGSVVAVFIGLSIPRFLQGGIGQPVHITDLRLWRTLGTEIVLAAIWLPFLRRRGWVVSHTTRAFESMDVLRCLGLAGGAWFLTVPAYYAAIAAWPGFAARLTFRFTGTVSWLTVLGLVVLNPVFEEAFYEGYIANVLRRSGSSVALGVSAAVRLVIHLYQGRIALVTILPTGLLFTGYYLRTRRLWPLIVGHALLDLIALVPLAHGIA